MRGVLCVLAGPVSGPLILFSTCVAHIISVAPQPDRGFSQSRSSGVSAQTHFVPDRPGFVLLCLLMLHTLGVIVGGLTAQVSTTMSVEAELTAIGPASQQGSAPPLAIDSSPFQKSWQGRLLAPFSSAGSFRNR